MRDSERSYFRTPFHVMSTNTSETVKKAKAPRTPATTIRVSVGMGSSINDAVIDGGGSLPLP